jgi:uncharacterized protein (TIGR02391 family)
MGLVARTVRQALAAAAALQRDASAVGLPQGSPELRSPVAEDSPISQFDVVVRNEHVRGATKQLYRDGHYGRAVEEAFKCLNNHVKQRAALTQVDGDALMRTAFSANNPILRLNKGRTQSDRDEQQGYMDIFAGCMKGIRNPRAHDHQLEDDPATALELLTMASHLMDRLQQATRSRKNKSSTP